MAAKVGAIDAQHLRYLAARTLPEDDLLRDLRADAARRGLPDIAISSEQAAFLRILLRATGAREVVEVGTLGGYSAISLARALPPRGRLRTIEISPAHAAFAEEWIERSDVADRIEVVVGDARSVLTGFGDSEADAVFIDADKRGYPTYLEEGLRIVRTGGLIAVDNAFAFGQLFDDEPTDPSVPDVVAFNDLIADDDRLESIIAPFGDGCWIGVKVAWSRPAG